MVCLLWPQVYIDALHFASGVNIDFGQKQTAYTLYNMNLVLLTLQSEFICWSKKLFPLKKSFSHSTYLFLFDSILLTPQSTIFQLCPDESSWVEPVLSKHLPDLLKDTMQWRRWGLSTYLSSACEGYRNICLKRSLSKRPQIGFQDQLPLKAGQKYCRMLQGEHSAILSNFIKLPFVNKIFVLFIFEWPLYTGFTVH